MKEYLFYFKIKKAQLGELELRKAEIAVKATCAAEAIDKLSKAGVYGGDGEFYMHEIKNKE